MLRLSFFIIITLMSYCVSAQSTEENLLDKLSEAEDYLRIQPSISSAILKKHLSSIGELSINDQLTWHQNLLRASIALNDLKQVESTVIVMLSYPELEKEVDKFVSLLSSLGIFLRRTGHPNESILLFNCGLKQPIKSHKQKISLLISKGKSLNNLKKYSQAKAAYDQALQLAQQNNSTMFISAIYNALGMMAIKQGNYPLAKEHLINALQLSQSISRRTGQIAAGLQLLMLSILDNDPILYEKLHYRISRLTFVSKNESKQTYLFWIEKAQQVSKGKKLSLQEQQALLTKLETIKPVSIGLYNQLVEKLAKPLEISPLPIVKKYTAYQGDLLNHIHQCNVAE